MSAALWYWREGPTQHGPITWEKLQSLASAGKIAPSDWVMREGWNDWKLACEANDPTGKVEPVGPLPAPPLLPLPMPNFAEPPRQDAAAPIMLREALPVAPAPLMGPADPAPLAIGAQAPYEPAGMKSVQQQLLATMLLPLPPLAPEQTVGDIGPPPPSPDGVSEGDVVQLRQASRDGQAEDRPAREFNAAAITALAASTMGLLFLAFEMGLVGVGLGGWCLCAASATGRSNGKGLALAAVVIGAVNVVFRVTCATMDLGLRHL